MALIYSQLAVGEHDVADRFGLRAGFRSRAGQRCDNAREIEVDQDRDVWEDFASIMPAPAKRAYPPQENGKAFILHKEPNGSWLVDRWMADAAGTIRTAVDAAPARGAGQDELCFIIEMRCASR